MQELHEYHEVLAQLEALASHDLPLEAKVTGQNAMKEEIEKVLGPEQIAKEAKQLADSVIKIDQGFERVKIELGGVDNGHFRGKPVEKLQPQWVGHQQFVNVILPTLENLKSHVEYKEAAADLREFAMRKNPFEHDLVPDAKDERHSLSFTELRFEIKAFRDNFELFMEEQGIELEDDVVRLQEDISDLIWQIKRFEVAISSPEKGSVAAVSALALFSPMSSLSIFLSGVIDAVPEYADVASFISKTNGNYGSHFLMSRIFHDDG
ncbi:hypothetical protein C0995_016253 [Termitomyces sp. Mi166|nr:hypothetical protein C0995_016253 [Termitomyces sp. Mi166\